MTAAAVENMEHKKARLNRKERYSMGINGVSSYANTYTYGNVKPSKNSEKNYYAGYTMNSANKFKNVSDYSKYLNSLIHF